MRYETRIERIGENMGPIDWSYDFLQHFSNYCCDEARKKEMCDRAVELLRKAEDPAKVKYIEIDGYRKNLYEVCMYDGWPSWRRRSA